MKTSKLLNWGSTYFHEKKLVWHYCLQTSFVSLDSAARVQRRRNDFNSKQGKWVERRILSQY